MAAAPSVLAHAKAPPPLDAREVARALARTKRKSRLAQRREILTLKQSIGMLTTDEYYYYGLYDDRFSGAEKARFLGLAAQHRILATCADRMFSGIVHDKLVFQHLLQAHGIAMPRIVATYHPARSFPGAAALRTTGDLEDFLRRHAGDPLFGKPVDGMFSVGSARVDGYDLKTDRVTLHTGEAVPVPAFVHELSRYAKRGYLFQEVKHPHERLRAICGDRVACVRLVILVDSEGPTIFRALWKIPTGPHVADNFWRHGNMLAALDIASGRIIRVVTGIGPEQREVDRHPDTGHPFRDTVIPGWEDVKALCLTTVGLVPGLTMQAWDIAVCPDGPVVIEANVGGDFNLPQLASGAGLLDDRFARFLREVGYAPRNKLVQAATTFVPWPVQRVVRRLGRALR